MSNDSFKTLLQSTKVYVLFFLFASSFSMLKGQDSLSFRSNLEKRNFEQYLLDTNDVDKAFVLFLNQHMDMDSSVAVNQMQFLTDLSNEIKTSKQYRKGGKKLVQYIHQELHQRVFKKYVLESTPEQLITDGIFNCVTGTIYTYFLAQKLGFDCILHKEPNHVYLDMVVDNIAYPFETTDANFGYLKYSDAQKKLIVEQLLNTKLIVKSDYPNMSTYEIFDKLYAHKAVVSLKQMLAIQYFNQGIFAVKQQNHEQATYCFAKAYRLSPETSYKVNMLNNAVITLLASSLDTDKDIYMLQVVAKHVNQTNSDRILIPIYLKYAHQLLVETNKSDMFDVGSQQIIKQITDSVTLANISFEYYYQLARYNIISGNYPESKNAAIAGLEINPDHRDLLNILLEQEAQLMQQKIPSKEKVDELLAYASKYTRLNDMKFYADIVYAALHDFALQNIKTSKISVGLKYLELTENYNAKYQGNPEPEVAKLYQLVAVYYFEKNRLGDARKHINKAIAKDPNNPNLSNFKRVILN